MHGIVIRNFRGEPMAAKASSGGLTMDPTAAELFAAIDLVFRKIILEGDSRKVINALDTS